MMNRAFLFSALTNILLGIVVCAPAPTPVPPTATVIVGMNELERCFR